MISNVKVLGIILVLISFSFPVTIGLEIKGGANFTDFSGWEYGSSFYKPVKNAANQAAVSLDTEYLEKVNNWGVQASVGVPIELNRIFTIQPELTLSTKRNEYDDTLQMFSFNLSSRYLYLGTPILFKITPFSGKKIAPVFYTGPNVEYLLSVTRTEYFDWPLQSQLDIDTSYSEVVIYDNNGNKESVKPVRDYYKPLNFGLIFGAGVNFHLRHGYIITDFSYSLGFTNILKEYINDEREVNSSLKIRSATFMIGYGFTF